MNGLTWMATGIAAAIGPVLMGRAFDVTSAYDTLLSTFGLATFLVAFLMFGMPDYRAGRSHNERVRVG